MIINLHIEKLILHGFVARDGAAISKGVEGELTRLLSRAAVPAALSQPREIASITSEAPNLRTDSSANGVGVQIARAVNGGFRRA